MPVGIMGFFWPEREDTAPPRVGHPDRGKRSKVKAARKANRRH